MYFIFFSDEESNCILLYWYFLLGYLLNGKDNEKLEKVCELDSALSDGEELDNNSGYCTVNLSLGFVNMEPTV